jgi:YesN/AraC family two-component response regulator
MFNPEEPLKVLVIDNEEKICLLIKTILKLYPYFDSIMTADSAFTALQKMQNQHFDLIIVDQVMPTKDGLSFIEQSMRTFKSKNIKYILISGYLKEEDVHRALQLGVQNVLVKPFTKQQLLDKIANIYKIIF